MNANEMAFRKARNVDGVVHHRRSNELQQPGVYNINLEEEEENNTIETQPFGIEWQPFGGKRVLPPRATPRAAIPITKEIPHKTTRPPLYPAGTPWDLPAVGAPSRSQWALVGRGPSCRTRSAASPPGRGTCRCGPGSETGTMSSWQSGTCAASPTLQRPREIKREIGCEAKRTMSIVKSWRMSLWMKNAFAI